MGATKEQAKKTKRDLLDAALIVFSKKGFNTARLEDISQQAGVTRGAFYWHFKNKIEVFSELHKQIMSDFLKSMKDTVDESQSPLRNLKNIITSTVIRIQQDEKTKRIGKLFYAFENTPELVPVINQLRKEMKYPVRTFFSEIIDKGKEKYEIRNDIDTVQIFKATVANMQGIIIQIFNDISPITKNDIKCIVNIFIDGIKKRTVESI